MSRTRPSAYHFTDRWWLDAPYDAVFDVLADLEHYPQWWSAVRRIEAIDRDTAEARLRSRLPYTLQCTLRRSVQDRDRGLLEVELGGDLVGFARWSLAGWARGTTATYEQHVRVTATAMRLLGPVAHRLFRLNHHWMMQDGLAGLRRWLSD